VTTRALFEDHRESVFLQHIDCSGRCTHQAIVLTRTEPYKLQTFL
jgi:hypothetical protein